LRRWFSGSTPSYFAFDKTVGTVIGYPEEYGSVAALERPSFSLRLLDHGGRAPARVSDPQWASPGQMGGWWICWFETSRRRSAVAQTSRFCATFDPYEGHSWAGGDGEFFGHGNNQESSSEAINAWAGIALWGSQTGQQGACGILEIYLYATEVSSLMQYWFDADDQRAGQGLWQAAWPAWCSAAAYAYSTWWTEEPRQITGINWLPDHASLQLPGAVAPAQSAQHHRIRGSGAQRL
jgi:hypothetical protein